MKHCLIIIPGLGDNDGLLQKALISWDPSIKFIIHKAPWGDIAEPLDKKLIRLIVLIDKLTKEGFIVSLLGTSAGASLVLNAYAKRKTQVNKVICVCGRLRTGNDFAHAFYPWSKRSPAFFDSVRLSEENQKSFQKKDFEKFLVFNALYDDLVPLKTSVLSETRNIRVPMITHLLSIAYVMVFKRNEILKFINS